MAVKTRLFGAIKTGIIWRRQPSLPGARKAILPRIKWRLQRAQANEQDEERQHEAIKRDARLDVSAHSIRRGKPVVRLPALTEKKQTGKSKCTEEMMKKILVVLGGGRPNGNTSQLADAFVQGAVEAGHKVEKISLNQMEVKGCLGCNACRYGKPCVQKDAFNELVPKIKSADLIVFASPLLFWTLSSKIKAFIERFYCIAEEEEHPPYGRYEKYPVKDAALLMTSADNLFWTYEQAVSYYRFAIINYIGFQDKGMVLAGGCGSTNGKPQIDKTNHLAEAYEFGKSVYMR